VVVLGIETSSLHGGVALVGEAGLIAEYALNIDVTYSERLLPAIDRLLADAGLAVPDLGGLAVAIGPGSFTGLRIGLTTAKALAAASGKPLVGVPTLRALAWSRPFTPHPICPVLDARKGEVYCALFRWVHGELTQAMDDAALAPEALAGRITEPTLFVGDGVSLHGPFFRRTLGPLALLSPPSLTGARPAAVAALGRERLLRGEREDPAGIVPRYLRPSEAELKRAAVQRGAAGQASPGHTAAGNTTAGG
jgi:tRNA threonylcarbamoyladenosine biosynthesis protein TsaB